MRGYEIGHGLRDTELRLREDCAIAAGVFQHQGARRSRHGRPGEHVTVLAYGAMVPVAVEAAETAMARGWNVEVVDLRTLVPLDRETICASVRKTSKALLLHEDTRTGGMAGELAATITESVFEYLDGPIVRVTAPDTPVPYSPPLEEAFLPNAEKVVEKARWLYRY